MSIFHPRDAEPALSLEWWASQMTLATVAVLGAVGVLLAGQSVTILLAVLLAVGLVFNLALVWLERRSGHLPHHLDWVGYLGNLACITAGLHLSWGLASPYLPLYAVYITTGALHHGRRGAMQCVLLSMISLLTLLALGRSLALEPLVRLAINVGLLLLTGVVAGTLGQRRIDAAQAAERRAEELSALNEMGRAINARLDVDRLLEEIRRQASRLVDVSNFCVALLDEETGQLTFPLCHRDGRIEKDPARKHEERLIRYVVSAQKPILLDDISQESQAMGLGDIDHPSLSWLGVPMIVGEKVLGVIALHNYDQRNAFDSGHAEILRMIASQAAVALENARLYQKTRQQAETFRVLAEISQRLTRPAAPEDVLSPLLELLAPIISFDGYALYLYEAQPVERMRIIAALELTLEERERAEQTALERHPGWVVRNRKTLRVEDTSADSRVHYLRTRPPRSILHAPLRYEDRCLGVIALGRFGPPPFNEAEERLLQAIADQAAVAVENTRLYQELKERAEQLHQAYEELRDTDRQRAEFVQDVSHDLRAPLTFIKGYVTLALQGDLGPLTEQMRESMRIVLEKTSLLARMAEDIVMLEHPEISLDTLAPISLPNLVRAALRGAEATAQATHVTLRAETPADLPQVLADSRKLMQVFDNLISNAIKYSPDGGTVTVSVQDRDDAIQVAVQDEGIGIPEEAQARIFERFYEVDPSRTRRFGSVGLGLAIVKEVIASHGGKVWVESKVGRGSTFYFTLPKTVSSVEPIVEE